jgi:hypothetical protein
LRRIAPAAFMLLHPGTAAASDYAGTFALFIGTPALLVGLLVSRSLAQCSHATLKKYGGLIISACLLVDVVVAKGASDLSIPKLGIFVHLYLAAFALLLYLQFKLIKSIPPQDEADDGKNDAA